MEFTYKAKTNTGTLTEGKVEASSEESAVIILQNKGLVIFSLLPVKKDLFSADLNQMLARPNLKDVVIFTRQLSTLIDADIPLAEGLRTLTQQMDKPSLKKIIGAISESVEGGSSLSTALAAFPKLFSSFYIKLVQSGEVSGKLHTSLQYLADYLERSQAINSKIKGALSYPAFVLFSLTVVAIIMVTYVLPQLLSIFKEAGANDLPFTTKILIWVTDFVHSYSYVLLGIIVAATAGLWQYVKTPAGRLKYDAFKIKIPSLGMVIRNLYLARIGESLATLVAAGISILDALKITADLVGNQIYRNILLEAEESIRGGGSISEIMSRHPEVPPLFASMVAIGEKTGKLDFMLSHISKFYKSESDGAIDNISQLIEPILVLLLGIGVAILVSSILLPIYSLVSTS